MFEEQIISEKEPVERARRDARQGKTPSTQAGEFVREEIEHIRKGKHGARSTKQAIAIGLSKARRAGVLLGPPKKGRTSEKTRRSTERAYEKGQAHEPVSRTRSRAREKALQREPHEAASLPFRARLIRLPAVEPLPSGQPQRGKRLARKDIADALMLRRRQRERGL